MKYFIILIIFLMSTNLNAQEKDSSKFNNQYSKNKYHI
jgi:uncharacterized membrane protein YciS (DUF1049 family)